MTYIGGCHPGSGIWLRGGGGAVLREGRHIDNECMRSQGQIRKAGGGGGGGGGLLSASRPMRKAGWERGVLSASGPIRKVGGGGGGAGGNWSQRAAFHMNGGGGGAAPPQAYAGSGAGGCVSKSRMKSSPIASE